MKLALFAHNAALIERWRSALERYDCRPVNWSQIDQLSEMQPLLVHWQSMTPDERDEIKRICLDRAVVVFSDTPKTEEGRELILAGVRGYANSYIHATLLPDLMDEVQRGNVWAVPEILQAILRNFLHTKPAPTAVSYNLSDLSEREAEVYAELMTGASNKDIARRLNITERTVKAHVAAILKKSGAPDRVHLIVHGVS